MYVLAVESSVVADHVVSGGRSDREERAIQDGAAYRARSLSLIHISEPTRPY